MRAEDVDRILVNKHGRPWTGDGFTGRLNHVRDAVDIARIDDDTDLTDQQIANIMGWVSDKVARIRRIYVDQSRIIVALGERTRWSGVNRRTSVVEKFSVSALLRV